MPDVYTDVPSELEAIRAGVAMCEMSPIPGYEVSGPDAQARIGPNTPGPERRAWRYGRGAEQRDFQSLR